MSQSGSYVELRAATGWARGDSTEDFRAGGGFKANFRVGGGTPIPLHCYTDVQNESIWQLKSETADARGGAREGRPRHSRIFPVVSGG